MEKGTTFSRKHRIHYIAKYYGDTCDIQAQKQMKACMESYPETTVPFGRLEDEHVGEQFYNDVVRDYIYRWMKDGAKDSVEPIKARLHKIFTK